MLSFAQELSRPLVVALRAVLSAPTEDHREVLAGLCSEAERVIVMTEPREDCSCGWALRSEEDPRRPTRSAGRLRAPEAANGTWPRVAYIGSGRDSSSRRSG